MQLASYLEGRPLMWMMLLHLHVNLNADDDDHHDDDDDDNDDDDDDDDDESGYVPVLIQTIFSTHPIAIWSMDFFIKFNELTEQSVNVK